MRYSQTCLNPSLPSRAPRSLALEVLDDLAVEVGSDVGGCRGVQVVQLVAVGREVVQLVEDWHGRIPGVVPRPPIAKLDVGPVVCAVEDPKHPPGVGEVVVNELGRSIVSASRRRVLDDAVNGVGGRLEVDGVLREEKVGGKVIPNVAMTKYRRKGERFFR